MLITTSNSNCIAIASKCPASTSSNEESYLNPGPMIIKGTHAAGQGHLAEHAGVHGAAWHGVYADTRKGGRRPAAVRDGGQRIQHLHALWHDELESHVLPSKCSDWQSAVVMVYVLLGDAVKLCEES